MYCDVDITWATLYAPALLQTASIDIKRLLAGSQLPALQEFNPIAPRHATQHLVQHLACSQSHTICKKLY